ncbi:MAG: filamentous hemagglutinin N-terminal domain-containing protein [Oleispira sp.]|nr:filamentous hemagglutinin N-terminal domain-containing protein [Oleispira sp.]
MDVFRKKLSESMLIRLTSYCLIFQLIFPPFWVNSVYAALVTDPNANVQFQPRIDSTSAVPVINIVAPNNSGLSHNKYQDFDVTEDGIVFNNSLVTGNSRLAGRVIANPLFGGRTASIILNEVTGASESELKGLMEIFGDKANIIIANPNGITCNGCGFINTQRATITTGTPDFTEGKLKFDIDGGLIRFEGEGHSYRSFINEMDVLAQYIDISGDISTKNRLSLVAGRFIFDYSKSIAGGSLTEWVEPKEYDAIKTTGRVLAIDGTIFGAMQAGQIDIMGTEQGLGVKVDGYLFAQADDLFIQSAGGLSINNADAVREIKLSAQGNIEIGADLIANLAIKAKGESISTSEETNLIANKIDLYAEKNINLNGDIKALELGIKADTIVSAADLLAINSLVIAANKEVFLKDSTLGSKQSNIETSELIISNVDFNVSMFNIKATKSLIEDTTIDVDSLGFDLGNIVSNNLKLFANTAVINYENWNDAESQWNISDLYLAGKQLETKSSSWLISKGDLNVADLSFTDSILFSYETQITANNFSSNNSKYYAEKLTLNIAETLSSIDDHWKILPFSDESELLTAGSFHITSEKIQLSGSIIQTDKYEQKAKETTFSNTGIAANTLNIASDILLTDADTLWIANNKIDITAQQAQLKGTIKTTDINLVSDNSDLSGQWLVADTVIIDVDETLNLKNMGITSKALVTSFEQGTWDNLIVKTQTSNISANNNLILIKATLESEIFTVDTEQLQIDSNSWLGANEMRIDTDVLTNHGTLLTANKLELNSRQIDNFGEIASFETININNEEALKNEGRIIANDLLITTHELINRNSIGSQNLELVYQNVTNSDEAVLSSQNAIYKAKTNTASFTNYGTQIASDSMSWLTLAGSSGRYINAGLLSGTQVNFTGLNTVQNGLLIDGEIKGTIQALTNNDNEEALIEGTLTIGAEEFTQLGTIKANQVSITRSSFHNEGTIHSDQFSADTAVEFTNSGVIGSQTINITTAKLTNNASSIISATNTNISNANIINAGELISNEFNITGSAADSDDFTNTFTNTASGVVVQNARFEQLDDGSSNLLSLGSASISGFETFTNSGLIETDGLLSITNIKAFNNLEDDLSNLEEASRIVSKSGIKLSAIDAINNEATIVANAIAIDAYSINNSGILGAGEASINITTADAKTGQLTNSGKIYQSDLIATEATRNSLSTIQNQFNINTTDLDNLSAAAIEIKQGRINLDNGDLRNLGLISEIDDADNDSSLSLSGIRNLENYNDISISTDLHIEENGSLRNLGEDSYINAKSLTGGSTTKRLSILENEGSLLIKNQVNVYADNVINDSEARLLAKGILIDSSNSINNKGLIGAENDLNITSKILINSLLSELYSAEGSVSLTANSELNNAGRILAKQDINLESNTIINSGLTSAEKSLLINQKTAGFLTNDGLMIGENLLVGNDLFRQKALINNGRQTQDSDGNTIYQGLQSTSGNVQIITETLGNSGSIISANDLVINATGDMTGEFAMSGQLEAAQQFSLTGTSLTLTHTGRINASGSEHQIELSETLDNEGVIALANSASINSNQVLNSGIIQGDRLQLQAASSINNQGENSTIFANTLALTGSTISNDGLIHGNKSLLLNAMNAVNNNQGAKLTSLGILQIRQDTTAESILAVTNSGVINTNGLSIDSKSLTNKNEAIIAAGEARLSITNLINEGTVYQTDDLVIAEERALLASSEGAFNITANAINNLGVESSIDIKNGVIDVGDLTNEGSLRERETSANSSDSLLLTNVESLNNSGEIVLYSDLLLNNSSIKNTGANAYLRANSIMADSVVAFENSGKIASQNVFSLNTANDFTNSGEIVASNLQISSDKKLINNKLLQAENNITLNANVINNSAAGEISTTSADSVLILNGTSAITNDGLLASRGNITANTQTLTNNKNISASKTTVLNVDSLGNSGLIYGDNLIVGSAGNQFKNIAQPSGIRTFSSAEQKGLVAANSLTLYTQGILNDVYQAANINISSDSALTLNGSLIANNQANITSTNFTNNGKVDIGDSALTSTWDVQGTLTNNGIINSKSNLLLNADTTSNDGALNTTKALTINTKTFTNKSNGSLSNKGQLTISGKGQSLTDRSTSFTNAGTIVADQGFDLSANSISNNNNIEVTGNSQWHFNSLSNGQENRISIDGDWRLGSSANPSGSITNYGKLYAANIDFYGCPVRSDRTIILLVLGDIFKI